LSGSAEQRTDLALETLEAGAVPVDLSPEDRKVALEFRPALREASRAEDFPELGVGQMREDSRQSRRHRVHGRTSYKIGCIWQEHDVYSAVLILTAADHSYLI
jgi:hypothetical protein